MEVKIGKKYRYFKGNLYEVLHIAYDCESSDDNLKKMVVYKALYGDNKIWVREYDQFISKFDKDKYPDVDQVYRFEEIDSQS